MTILATRTVTVTTNLPPDLSIQIGTSVPIEITATVSGGGGSQFQIGTVSAPPAILGPPSVTKDLAIGFQVIDESISCITQPGRTTTGKQSVPLVLGWTVPADSFHPADATGSITFNITIPAVTHSFSLAQISAGEVTASNLSASFASNGGWTFSGSLHDFSTFFGDNFALGVAFNFTDDAVHGAMVTGELGSSLTSNPEDIKFGKSGNDPWLVDNWQAAFADGVTWRLHVAGDPGQVLSDLGDDFKTFFGKTIWQPFPGGPDCPVDPETGEPDCPPPDTIEGGDDGD
ncbi:MAG TPA: hypothetical protein VML19_11565 [Verrucomicrobiae bacterium]|nr:hypothetical protein [Verrucomicrobiae bacterium]